MRYQSDLPPPIGAHAHGEAPSPQSESFEWMDLATLRIGLPAPRRWVWDQWIGRGHVTAMFGRGGSGKSLLALQIATALALGRAPLSMPGQHVRTMALFCEDDFDELHRRLYELCKAHVVTIDTLAHWLNIEPRQGMENVLMKTMDDRSRDVFTTDLFKSVRLELEREHEAGEPYGLLILDNISQHFQINHNDLVTVNRVVNILTRLAMDYDIGILLLGHTAKALDSQFAGSMAWSDAVRSRLLFARVEVDGMDTAEAVLKRMKANYAGRDTIPMRYDAGVFKRTDTRAEDKVEQIRRDNETRESEAAVLHALAKLTAQDLRASNKPTARNYLPRLAEQQELLDGVSIKQFTRAMFSLIEAKELGMIAYRGKDRREYVCLQAPSHAA